MLERKKTRTTDIYLRALHLQLIQAHVARCFIGRSHGWVTWGTNMEHKGMREREEPIITRWVHLEKNTYNIETIEEKIKPLLTTSIGGNNGKEREEKKILNRHVQNRLDLRLLSIQRDRMFQVQHGLRRQAVLVVGTDRHGRQKSEDKKVVHR